MRCAYLPSCDAAITLRVGLNAYGVVRCTREWIDRVSFLTAVSDGETMTVGELERILAHHENILIVTHNNPDPDALAAGFGLQFLFSDRFEKSVTLAYGGVLGRAENQAMVSLLKIPLVPMCKLNVDAFQAYALVDAQPSAGNHSLPPDARPVIVVDHHPSREGNPDGPSVHMDIRVEYGATSTIVAEYLFASYESLPKDVATALYCGIRSDTLELGREAGPPDEYAYVKLFPLIDKPIISQIHYPDLPPEFFILSRRAIEDAEIYDHFLFTFLGVLPRPGFLAQMSDILVRLKGIRWVASCGVYGQDLHFSVRSDLPDAHAGSLVRGIVEGRGSAGGHRMMAGGMIGLEEKSQKEIEAMVDWVRERFIQKLGLEDAHRTTIAAQAQQMLQSKA